MNKYVIRLTSVTYAIRAQKLLEQRGFRVYLKKLTSGFSAHGCGYGIVITGDINLANQIISAAGITILEVTEAV